MRKGRVRPWRSWNVMRQTRVTPESMRWTTWSASLDLCRASREQTQDARHSGYVELMKTLGQRMAEFHRALALPDDAGDFGSEPIGPQDILDWVNRERHQMERSQGAGVTPAARVPAQAWRGAA